MFYTYVFSALPLSVISLSPYMIIPMHGLVLSDKNLRLYVYASLWNGPYNITVTLSLEDGTSTVLYNFTREPSEGHMFELHRLEDQIHDGESPSHVDFRRVDVRVVYRTRDDGSVPVAKTYFYISRLCERV